MQCPKCDRQLFIGKTFISFKGDESAETPTEAYTNLPMCCVNPQCDNYAGKDLSNPKHVVTTVVNKIN